VWFGPLVAMSGGGMAGDFRAEGHGVTPESSTAGLSYRPPGAPSLRLGKVGQRVASDLPGRNDPCWCGSGKKFKKCHGR
jgi:hypothetical protein